MAKNSIKDYFSICPIVQDQTREPNEEPEDLCKLKFCLCYSRITMLRVPDNLNIKTSYNQNIKIPFPGIYVAVKTLLTYPVSTCVAERSCSSMKRLKTPLRNTMSEDRLSSLSVLHIHKHKELDVNEVISEFARRKNRRLALCL